MNKFNRKLLRISLFIFTVLVIFILAGSYLWWELKKGIDIGRIAFDKSEIEQLFVQLDRGLIIRMEHLTVAEKEATGGEAALDTLLPYLKKWGYVIQEIDIKKISYPDQTVTLTYRDGDFHFSGDQFNLSAEVSYALGAFYFDITRLDIKPYNITFTGDASYVRKEKRFLYSGNFASPWGNGELRISEKKGLVEAKITNVEVAELVDFLRLFPLEKGTVDWIDENISAESYKINTLEAVFSLDKLKTLDPANIRGDAVAEKATVRFNPKLPPVQSSSVKITFRDDILSFIPINPVYNGKKLDGSYVDLENVIGHNSILAVHIKTENLLDQTVLDLLQTYDFELPLRQISGTTRGEVDLLFDPPEFSLQISGRFATGSGKWTWRDLPLHVREAVVKLTDDKMIIEHAGIEYNDTFRTALSGRINLSSRHAKLKADIEHLHLTAQDRTILQADEIEVPLDIDFSSESSSVGINPYGIFISRDEQGYSIDIADLKAVAPFVPFLQDIAFTDSSAEIVFSDPSQIEFRGVMKIPNSLLTQEDKPVDLFRFQGSISPEKTKINVNDDRILIDISKQIKVTLNDYLTTIKYDEISDSKRLSFPLEIKGKKALLLIKDLQLPTRDFTCRIVNKDVEFQTSLDQGSIRFRSTDGRIYLTGNGLDAKILDEFIHFSDLSEGVFDINLVGDSLGYNGYMTFGNVVIRDYLLLYNLIAFLNSIPALATFSEPGFDKDGYEIKDGILHFDLQNGLLTIRQLSTEGTTVNCEAKGWIDFDTRTIQMDIELITLKDYSKIIDMLPWANYALLGEDGTLSTSIKVSGSLDNPVIKTYLARDLVMTPINVLKRTIEWPFKVFSESMKKGREPSEQFPFPMAPE